MIGKDDAGPGALHVADGEAFAALVSPHLKFLHSVASRWCGSFQDAEELVQELLLKLYANQTDLGALAEPRPWLTKALYRQFIDWKRSRKRERFNLSLDQFWEEDGEPSMRRLIDSIPADGSDPENMVLRHERHALAESVLQALGEGQRQVLALHYIDELSLPQIEALTGIPVNSLKSTVLRSTESLRRRLVACSRQRGRALRAEDAAAGSRRAAGGRHRQMAARRKRA